MNTKLKRQLFLALTVALLYVSGLTLVPLQGMRTQYDLASEPVKGITPKLALATQVLGWGRGLIIDVIWIRMESLKQQDRFFELVQLAEWACNLAPRFPQVWDIQSWNLAYNVSCQVEYLPDRWAWVQEGIELLRDEGIPWNPHSAMLYDRLAMIYFHKIGEQDDNAHFFYKQKFGLLMHEVLGGEGDEQTLQAFTSAPETREELLKDPQVKRLVAACAAHDFELVGGFWEVYQLTESVPVPVRRLVLQPENGVAMRKIQTYARSKRLREEYKMDPERMLALRERLGPFDWRSAYPHAIYWATVGLERLDELEARTLATIERFGITPTRSKDIKREQWKEEEGIYEFRRVMLKRIVYASMQSLVRQGRLLFDTRGRLLLEAGADYRFADATLPLYEEVIEAHGQRFKMGTRQAFLYFLRRGVVEFSFAGDAGEPLMARKAGEFFELLKEKFPDEVDGMSFDEYRRSKIIWFTTDMTTAEARRLVGMELTKAYFALACGATDTAAVIEAKAKARAQRWNDDAEPNLRGRVRYDQVKEAVLTDILTGRVRFPEDVAGALARRLEERGGDGVVRRVLANLKAGEVRLPRVEDVDDRWKQQTY